MSRVHKRWLGLSGNQPAKHKTKPIERVTLTAQVAATMRAQLEVGGAFRGGILFGKVEDGNLIIGWVTKGGYPEWVEAPLDVDSHYVLGWADALNTIDAEVDWVGHWLTYPTCATYSQIEDALWVHAAHEAGFLFDQQVFVFFGWDDGRLVVKPYLLKDELTLLEVEIEKSPHLTQAYSE